MSLRGTKGRGNLLRDRPEKYIVTFEIASLAAPWGLGRYDELQPDGFYTE